MKYLDSKATILFFLQSVLGWIFFVFFSFIGIFFIFLGETDDGFSNTIFSGGLILIILVITVGVVLLSAIGAYLTYKSYKYELTENGFRKESGVISKKYVTIPYEKIQNVDINRSLLSRILGLSDLHIQTAGASFSYQNKYGAVSEGRLPAINKIVAEELRDELIKRSKVK